MKFSMEYYGATWCGPCKYYKPIVERVLADDKYKAIEHKHFDVDETPSEKLIEIDLKAVPMTILFKDGKEVDRWLGALAEKQLRAKLDGFLG